MNRHTISAYSVILSGAALSFVCAVHAQAIEYLWTGNPIALELSTEIERSVTVANAESISVGIPAILNHRLDLQIIGNQFWMTPAEEFEPTRIVVMARPQGRLIFEISASADFRANPPVTVHFSGPESDATNVQNEQAHGFATLTRWAAQQLYAPKRLLKPLSGVVGIPIRTEAVDLFRCANRTPTLCAGSVVSAPIASWRSSRHFITAVQIANNLDQSVVLDPREILGAWRTASFLHAKLGPKGAPQDNTVVLLISDFPFYESLRSQS